MKRKKFSLKNVLNKVKGLKDNTLAKQIAFTIFCLFIVRLGSNILVSSTDPKSFNMIDGFTMFDLLTGANMSEFTLFALGLAPFITGSIIVELLSNDVIPAFSRWKKNGDNKKKTIAANIAGLIVAVIQSITYVIAIDKSYGMLPHNDIFSYIYTIAVLIAGSCILLWISKQIDAYGIGNGSSIIIAAGILYRLPALFNTAYNITVTYKDMMSFVWFGLLVLVYLGIIVFTVFVEKSERRVKIIFPNGDRITSNNDNYLPLKLNAGGVVPVIFAASIMQTPTIICRLLDVNPAWLSFLSMSTPQGIAVYTILIAFFVFFYAHTVVSGKDINRNLEKSGGNLLNVRPGQETIKFVDSTVTRLCFAGAIGLLIIALTPVILPLFWDVAANSGLTIGGTSLIIVTGVTFDIYARIKNTNTRKTYRKQSMLG